MKISIVTPVFNSVQFIEAAIVSVLEQGYENLEYIIVDGGSTDGTLEIIKKYESRIACLISEPDSGMYDAISKGFERASGDVFAWINADDSLLPGALSSVAQTFSLHREINWIHGRTVYVDERGNCTKTGPLFLFHQENLVRGYHGLCAHFVEQHCCFWRSSLWRQHGPFPKDLRYAGDYWLWTQFSLTSPLVSLNYLVATFRRHAGQLHKEGNNYRREVMLCFTGSRGQLVLRKVLRNIARRSDLDARLLNLISRAEKYHWIDPDDSFSLKNTAKTRIW